MTAHLGYGRLRAALATLVLAATGLIVAAPVGPALAATPTAFIRINQVGYVASAPKRAYLLASGPQTGATFSLRNGSTTVYTAAIGADLGSWSNAYPHVYALDFDSVATVASAYTIVVTGPIPATSPTFRIATGPNLYAGAIANSLAYYQVQRDGPNFIPSALRTAPAHLHDVTAMTYLTPKVNSSGRFSGDLQPLGVTLDASGGWFDAGDYLKFLHGAAYRRSC